MRLFTPDTEQNRAQQFRAARAARAAQQRAQLRQSLESIVWTGLAIAGVFAASVGALVYVSNLIPH
ncbi:MAG TPA: hypothetical protein VJ924_04420 [Alphaproteobacteria bacterium]|nr:hypothetical protein [Alphaproteobacteria bacterium]